MIVDASKRISATRRVFNTNELLEQILQHVPFGALLRSQGVCQHWRDVITTTPSLRKQLYMEPAQQTKELALPVALPLSRSPVPTPQGYALPTPHPLLELPIVGLGNPNTHRYRLERSDHGDSSRRYIMVEDGSWEDHVICQPPPRKVRVDTSLSWARNSEVMLEDVEGVRLVAIKEVLQEQQAQSAYRGFLWRHPVRVTIDILEF